MRKYFASWRKPNMSWRHWVAAIGLVAAGSGLGAVASAPDLFDQTVFPCAEDEVLGYSKAFGPNKVGCLPVTPTEGGLD